MVDVQGSADTRRIAINKVGIKAIRHPVKVLDKSGGVQHTIAVFNMYVSLPHNFKGTHMSRFVEILNSHEREISVENFPAMLRDMVQRLEAETGHIEMSFPYFINKTAPVSGVQSLMDYDVTLIGEICHGERYRIDDQGRRSGHQPVPVLQGNFRARRAQSALARDGHRQHQRSPVDRGNGRNSSKGRHPASSTGCSSAPTRSTSPNVLTTIRSSSKTWCAMSRRASTPSRRIDAYVVESENFESIHNHSAYALIENDKRLRLT
jgi:GTP cyclohydrolase I